MINLSDVLKEELVTLNLDAHSKDEVLSGFCRQASLVSGIEEHRLRKLLDTREELSSTAIGSGLAIPHARVDGLSSHLLGFARSIQGIDFDAVDGKPVYLLFLLFSPKDLAGEHLRFLAKLSKYLHDTSFREKLLRVREYPQLIEILKEKSEAYGA